MDQTNYTVVFAKDLRSLHVLKRVPGCPAEYSSLPEVLGELQVCRTKLQLAAMSTHPHAVRHIMLNHKNWVNIVWLRASEQGDVYTYDVASGLLWEMGYGQLVDQYEVDEIEIENFHEKGGACDDEK